MPGKVSPCQGWDPDTCRKTAGCTYVRGPKRRYCRRKRRRRTAKNKSLSPRSRMRLVVRELVKDNPRSKVSRRSVRRSRRHRRPRATRRAPRRPRGERAQLLRLQGELVGELKTVVKEARKAAAHNAPQVRSRPQGPRSGRETRSSAPSVDVLGGRRLETLSV